MFVAKRHRLVKADLQAAYDWYEDRRPGLGAEFAAEFETAYHHLLEFPLRHAVRFSDVRRLNLLRFPYGIFYVVRPPDLYLLAVLHTSRDTEIILQGRRSARSQS